jgi:GGDEF domain-containing protein
MRAHHDALTGLPNRMLFGKRLEGALHQAQPGAMVAQHLLDLDHFKNVNDTLGGTSIGIAIACDDGMNCDLLMRNADLALYKAKGDGRGALRFF